MWPADLSMRSANRNRSKLSPDVAWRRFAASAIRPVSAILSPPLVANRSRGANFPDHHAYTSVDRTELIAMAQDAQADTFVCTHKDLVKLRSHELGHVPLWAVAIEMRFLRGQESLERMVDELVKSRVVRDADQMPVVGG